MTASDGRTSSNRLVMIVAGCAVVGLATVGGALFLALDRNGGGDATEDYGRRLLTETSKLLGPDQPDPAMRYTGSRLQCSSCHLDAGASPGTLALLETFDKYPRFSGRDGEVGDLRARINGCMTRSMNGRKLPIDSPEMTAMVSYIRALDERYLATSPSRRAAAESKKFAAPDRAADPVAGKQVFEARCVICHGSDGQGLQAAMSMQYGYVFPPLWGDDSFNDGAGTHRVLTAATFIKARMPLGRADLTDAEAFDVSAYINVQPRPHMADLDKDYPDRATKPVDSPYGPYADPFPIEQHQLGPFKPIEAFYAALKKK
jgi:thiosulfate dehydrogenase